MEKNFTGDDAATSIKILCPKLLLTRNEPGLQWLIGSPFFPPLTIISTFKSIHTSDTSSSPDFAKESDDLRTLLIKGFDINGALIIGGFSSDVEKKAREAIEAARKLRQFVFDGVKSENREIIGAVADLSGGGVKFFAERRGEVRAIVNVDNEENPEKFIWERGCLVRCNVPIKVPVFVQAKNQAGAEKMYLCATEAVVSKFKDPHVTYMLERLSKDSTGVTQPVILCGEDLNFNTHPADVKLVGENVAQDSDAKYLTSAHFCLKSDCSLTINSAEM